MKDEFIGIAAHELRTPLAILKGFAQTSIVQTARGNGPALADWQMGSLQAIDQATVRMVELIDDLLDVTRLQADRLTLHPESTDLIALTRRVVTRMQMMAGNHHITLSPSAEYLVVNVDARRMEQVLTNLIGNAIKYSPSGGSIEIHIQPDTGAQSACLSIRDWGTGLGLYLCREIIERQGGRIWFESEEGRGSTFSVSVTLVEEEATA